MSVEVARPVSDDSNGGAEGARLIDWQVAARTAAALGRPGPRVGAQEAADIVAGIRRAAADAVEPVARVTRLDVPTPPPALVVDRTGWTRANIASFRIMLAPALDRVLAMRDKPPSAFVTGIGSRVTGAELGGALAFLSSRVLGQYDPFAPVAEGPAAGGPVADGGAAFAGRLMLVAPNLVHVQRELQVPERDFRLWVCLHEETHRAQFTATPWLAGHLLGEIRDLTADLLAGELLGDRPEGGERLAQLLRGLPDVLRGEGPDGASRSSLLDLIQSPEQRERVASITAVMSLLEGHADVMMDEVGPEVVPSVATIRARFTKRRAGRGVLDQAIRRLLGLDAKMRQYADGARFVRGVVRRTGIDGFNAVWAGPANLPTAPEIADPAAWVRRVVG